MNFHHQIDSFIAAAKIDHIKQKEIQVTEEHHGEKNS